MGSRTSFFVEQASSTAGRVDALFTGLTLVTIVFTLIVVVAIVTFAVRYRRGNKVDRSNPPLEHLGLELGWTIIPLVIALGIFAWATSLYFTNMRVPSGAMEINVVGKQWMWKLQHPTGRWEMNQLHVPRGRPVKLTMISEDVIHSFFIPAFRLKMDVYPGKYTTMWFQPTKVGTYHLFCAEYCGTNHSGMVGSVTVMEPADYERWLRTGNTNQTLAAAGERLFRLHGCSGCHGAGSSVRAPLLDGIYGKPVAIEVPTGRAGETRSDVVIADDRYIHDSIVSPEQEIAAGYQPIMPTFRGRLSEEEIVQLIDYIKTMGTSSSTNSGSAGSSAQGGGQNVTAQDIRTRTGFVPSNIGQITAASRAGGGTRGTGSSATRTLPSGATTANNTGVAGRVNANTSGGNTGGPMGGGLMGGGGGTMSGDVTKNITGGVPTSSTPGGVGNIGGGSRGIGSSASGSGTIGGDLTKNVTGRTPSSSSPSALGKQ